MVFAPTSWPGANEAISEDAVKAAYLYRIAGYVEWPAAALTATHFTFATLGADNVAKELAKVLPQRSVADRPAQVQAVNTPGEADDAQVLYIGKGYRGDLRRVVRAYEHKPVLIVTDDDDGLDAGAMVNFVSINRRVRFEVSLTAASRSGLKLGADLLSVAANVRGASLSTSGCKGAAYELCTQQLAAL
jgi:hypothetical protein